MATHSLWPLVFLFYVMWCCGSSKKGGIYLPIESGLGHWDISKYDINRGLTCRAVIGSPVTTTIWRIWAGLLNGDRPGPGHISLLPQVIVSQLSHIPAKPQLIQENSWVSTMETTAQSTQTHRIMRNNKCLWFKPQDICRSFIMQQNWIRNLHKDSSRLES